MSVNPVADGHAWGQRRAQHFMDLISISLAGLLQARFADNFWQIPFR